MPAKAAHKEAVVASVAAMVAELQGVLGQRIIAYAAGVRSPKVVARWMTGVRPHPDTEKKLRNLYRTELILKQSFGPATVRAWLEGANPDLGDKAPIELLREGHDVDVFRAAEDFIS